MTLDAEQLYHLGEIKYHLDCFGKCLREIKIHLDRIKYHKQESEMTWIEEPCEDPRLEDTYYKWLEESCKCEDLSDCTCASFDEWLDNMMEELAQTHGGIA